MYKMDIKMSFNVDLCQDLRINIYVYIFPYTKMKILNDNDDKVYEWADLSLCLRDIFLWGR